MAAQAIESSEGDTPPHIVVCVVKKARGGSALVKTKDGEPKEKNQSQNPDSRPLGCCRDRHGWLRQRTRCGGCERHIAAVRWTVTEGGPAAPGRGGEALLLQHRLAASAGVGFERATRRFPRSCRGAAGQSAEGRGQACGRHTSMGHAAHALAPAKSARTPRSTLQVIAP